MIKIICSLYCKLTGWNVINSIPQDLKQAVAIGYPHTSNWDFPTAMFIIRETKIPAKFAIKKEWLIFPIGYILKSIGAIGIDRKNKIKATESLANLFNEKKELFLLIAPEGTRSKRDKWKTGFYYAAQMANVPIILIKADYSKKLVFVGEKIIYPSNFEKDMSEIMHYFKDAIGKNPENASVDINFLK